MSKSIRKMCVFLLALAMLSSVGIATMTGVISFAAEGKTEQEVGAPEPSVYQLSDPDSSAVYGEYPFNDVLSAAPITTYGSGAIVTVQEGDVLHIDKSIKFSEQTITYNDWGAGPLLYPDYVDQPQTSDAAITMFFIPSVGYRGDVSAVDYSSMHVKFSGVTNPDENFTVTMRVLASERSCDFRISEINNVATTMETHGQVWHASYVNGYNNNDPMDEFLCMRIFYDEDSRKVYVGNSTGGGNTATALPGTVNYFYADEVKVDVWFEGYTSSDVPAKVMIGNLGGEAVPESDLVRDAGISVASEIQSVYGYGNVLEIPSAQYVNGSLTAAAQYTLTKPDGTFVSDASVTLSQFGEYTLQYYYETETVRYTRTFPFEVLRSSFTVGEGGSVTAGVYPYADSITWSNFLTNGYRYGNGVTVEVPKGTVLRYDQPIDVTGCVMKDDDSDKVAVTQLPWQEVDAGAYPLLSLAYVPSAGLQSGDDGDVDFKRMYITFYDADNPEQYFRIALKQDPDNSAVIQLEEVNGVNISGTRWEWINSQFAGYNTIDYYSDAILGLRIWYDYETKNIYAHNGDEAIGKLLGTAAGFTATKVKFTIEFDEYPDEQTPATIFINGIRDKSVSEFAFYTDTEAPSLTVDFGEYVEGGLPAFAVGEPFEVFAAEANDAYTGSDEYTVQAYFDYDGEKIAYPIEENKFTPDRPGDYALIYTAEDEFGNKTEKRVDLVFKTEITAFDIAGLQVTYADGADSMTYGQTLRDVTLSGGAASVGSDAVAGHFEFVSPDLAPDCAADGDTITVLVRFVPDDSDTYAVNENLEISLKIKKAVPQVKEAVSCTASGLKEGDALPALTGSFYDVDGGVLTGTIAWTQATAKAGENAYQWTFTPDDTLNYETVTGEIKLTAEAKPAEEKPEEPASTGCGGEMNSVWFAGAALCLAASCTLLIGRKRNDERKK